MKLYYSRNPNPRLALATARHLGLSFEFEWAAPFAPGQSERFRKLNPNLSIPILEEPGGNLWEADAIACRLSYIAASRFWRRDADEPDMIRWISWGKENFVRACDMVHFEYGTKQRYNLGPVDSVAVKDGLALFNSSARILNEHLATNKWLCGDEISYADFRMATFLPFNDVAGLPVADHPNILAWMARLNELPAWRDPFQGLNAPPLPAVPLAADRTEDS